MPVASVDELLKKIFGTRRRAAACRLGRRRKRAQFQDPIAFLALVQIVGTSKHSLLRRADFRPEAPRSRLQVPLGLGRPDVLV
jgi:hypothetical protein